uniref:Uncharacterized protein n=1 Tax=Arundo donax TaxID=35708 RepID=A0A0A9F3K0_ARUDO
MQHEGHEICSNHMTLHQQYEKICCLDHKISCKYVLINTFWAGIPCRSEYFSCNFEDTKNGKHLTLLI